MNNIAIKILKAFLDSDDERYYYYSWLEKQTGFTKKELQPVIKNLKNMGLIEHVAGLDEDGMTAGSGFQIPYKNRDWACRLVWDNTHDERISQKILTKKITDDVVEKIKKLKQENNYNQETASYAYQECIGYNKAIDDVLNLLSKDKGE